MQIVVITDIPRMASFFEQQGQHHPDLTVVSDIHRGIEELEKRKPEVVIIQNHLSGLSADILHKHLKSRLGHHKARFGLISTSAALDVDTSAQFETIFDPALDDRQLEQALERILHHPSTRHKASVSAQAASKTGTSEQEPVLPGLLSEPSVPELPQLQHQQFSGNESTVRPEQHKEPAAPITYEMPRRSGVSITSDFSNQLDTRSDAIKPEPVLFTGREQELRIRDLHREPHLISDLDEQPPWYRRTSFILISVTLAVVVAVSLFQHRTKAPTTAPPQTAPEPKTPPAPAPTPTVTATPEPKPALSSHGSGRTRNLPGFIPKEGLDPGYGKDNPGWENYRGHTNEYRVFREKDTTIKAIQVIDRSGAGIQDSFYTAVIKELTGTTTMRPTSSEIKEGYEIRRGELAGLQLVQYRDAQGGRMRGFVITWP